MTTEKRIDLLNSNLNQLQEMIKLADTKVNISLTLQTFIAGYVLTSTMMSKVFENLKQIPATFMVYVFYAAYVLFLITSLIGIVKCLMVYKARLPKDKNKEDKIGFLFFEHIKIHDSAEAYIERLNSMGENDWAEELANQVYNVSRIVSRKMKLVNHTIVFLFLNILLSITLTILAMCFIG